jgi:hypothetical protein
MTLIVVLLVTVLLLMMFKPTRIPAGEGCMRTGPRNKIER